LSPITVPASPDNFSANPQMAELLAPCWSDFDKILIPIGGTGFIIKILSTANEEAYSE